MRSSWQNVGSSSPSQRNEPETRSTPGSRCSCDPIGGRCESSQQTGQEPGPRAAEGIGAARRARASRRRSRRSAGSEWIAGHGLLEVDGYTLPLAPREFELLAYLLHHQGLVLTRDALLRAVWGPELSDDPRTLRVHINGLRAKLDRFDPPPSRSSRCAASATGSGFSMRPEAGGDEGATDSM